MGDFYKPREITEARFYFLTLVCFFSKYPHVSNSGLTFKYTTFCKTSCWRIVARCKSYTDAREKMSPVSKTCAIR